MATANIPNESPAKSAFLSHSSVDAALASELCQRLEAQGVRCWIAPRDIIPGRSWINECVRGIEQSAAFILLASGNAISSDQVMNEVEQAHKRHKPLYTVLVGKPKVSKELDYYISRLHWIEYGGDSIDTLATRLATVLKGAKDWTDIASPPSLRRTVLYRRDAFTGSAIATVLVLVLAAFGLYYWINRQLDLNYLRLGYVEVGADPPAKDSPVKVRARVWMLAENVPFRDAIFSAAAEKVDGTIAREDHSGLFNPEQVGSQELVSFSVPAGTRHLTTCLSVPSPGLHARYRVTQTFVLGSDGSLAPTSEPKVAKDSSTPCGAAS